MNISTPKYFGIGLQRTGTTSLHQAALMLGVRSAPMSTDLQHDLKSPIIDRYELFSDNPIPFYYQRLDQLYSGSKFILTTRLVDDWLKSVEWLLTHDTPNLAPELQKIADEVHLQLYGRTTFDESTFRAFWHSYHVEVERHFADRPDDLLRLDFSAGDGWEKLCRFLGKPIPDRPFPHSNQRGKRRGWRRFLL